jgi:hypothetical protein
MFAIFGRLTHDEEMPRIEELRHRMAIMILRVRLWLAAVGSRRRGRRAGGRVRGRASRARRPVPARRPVAAFLFPIALVMATVTIVLVARFGGTPRCTSATTVAAGKTHTRRVSQKPKACPVVVSPMFTAGR